MVVEAATLTGAQRLHFVIKMYSLAVMLDEEVAHLQPVTAYLCVWTLLLLIEKLYNRGAVAASILCSEKDRALHLHKCWI